MRALNSKRPRDYWKYLNKSSTKNEKSPSVTDFYEYFRGINTPNFDTNETPEMEPQTNITNTDSLNCQVTDAEILKAIVHCSNGKAASPQDSISDEYIKNYKNNTDSFL